jgi:hypothetical protein
LRDIVLREARHLMNLALFLLAHTGQTFSMQSLTLSLAIPSAAQTSRYLEYLNDAYLLSDRRRPDRRSDPGVGVAISHAPPVTGSHPAPFLTERWLEPARQKAWVSPPCGPGRPPFSAPSRLAG